MFLEKDNAGEKDLGSCDLVKGRVHTEEEKDLPVVRKRERKDV